MSFKKLLGAALWKGLLLSMVLLLALLAVSSLMLQRGLLPESAAPVMVCAAYAVSVFVGSRQAIRGGEGGAAAPGTGTGGVAVRGGVAGGAERRRYGLRGPWPAADGWRIRRCAAGGTAGSEEGQSARRTDGRRGSGPGRLRVESGGNIKWSMVKITKFAFSPKIP